MAEAVGILETTGLTGIIAGADAMSKASNVDLLQTRAIGGGYITVMVRGDVGAVRTALGAGRNAAAKIGQVISTRIIPGPHYELENILPESTKE